MKFLNEVQVSFNVAFGAARNDGELPAALPSTYDLHRKVSEMLVALSERYVADPAGELETISAYDLYSDDGTEVLADGQAVMCVAIYASSPFEPGYLRLLRAKIVEALAGAGLPEDATPRIHSVEEIRTSTIKERSTLNLEIAS